MAVCSVWAGLDFKRFILPSLVLVLAAGAASSFFTKQWGRIPVLMAVVIAFVAVYCTRAGLDFNNILLLWLVLAFVAGAGAGFFTEDARRGRANVVRGRICQAVGTIWGLSGNP